MQSRRQLFRSLTAAGAGLLANPWVVYGQQLTERRIAGTSRVPKLKITEVRGGGVGGLWQPLCACLHGSRINGHGRDGGQRGFRQYHKRQVGSIHRRTRPTRHRGDLFSLLGLGEGAEYHLARLHARKWWRTVSVGGERHRDCTMGLGR